MNRWIVLLVMIAFVSVSYAQERRPTDITAIFSDYSVKLEEEDHKACLAILEKVPSYDSTYEDVSYEIAGIYISLEDWDAAIAMSDEGIARKGENQHLFYQNKGYALLRKGAYEEALKVNTEGLKIFPMYTDLKYNNSIIYKEMENYKESVQILQDILRENPFYTSAHYELGTHAMRENELAKMMLCYNTYMMIQSNAAKNNTVLGLMNTYSTAKRDSVPNGIFEDETENFGRIDQLLENQVALDKGYKTGSDVKLSFVNQNHLLFSQLADGQYTKGGFWSEFYVPMYTALYNDSQFEDYSWFLLQYSTNDVHAKLNKKHKGDSDSFISWRINYVSDHWFLSELNDTERLYKSLHANNVIERMGPLSITNQNPTGLWKYYGSNGVLTSSGLFKDGNQEGEWIYNYDDGSVSTKVPFSEAKLNGLLTRYYKDGALMSEEPYKDGELDGEVVEYYPTGELSAKRMYKAGKYNGLVLEYHITGNESSTANYTDGIIQGLVVGYYPDGTKSYEGNIVDNKKEGVFTDYFENGKERSQYNYKAGILEGKGLEYYNNGNLSYEGMFKDGKKIGKQVSYAVDGSVDYESNFDESGKENGSRTYYDHEGNIHELWDYAKGSVVAYKFYDDNGAVVREAKKKGNEFEYNGLYFDGTPHTDGLFSTKGGREGEWKTYNTDGVLKELENFKDGEQHGMQKYFYTNGNMSSEYMMEDDELEGEYRAYYSNGVLRRNGNVIAGSTEGEWFDYYQDGKPREIEYYVNDQIQHHISLDLDGQEDVVTYYEDGRTSKIEYKDDKGKLRKPLLFPGGTGELNYLYSNDTPQMHGALLYGKRHGDYKYFEFNGVTGSEGKYFYGEQEGIWKYYHENGQLSSERAYDGGMDVGTYTRYDWFGNKAVEGQYEFDMQVGEWIYYHSNGEVESTIQYAFGENHGERRFFSPAGDLQMVRYYSYGLQTGYSHEGPDGELVPMIPIEMKEDQVKTYFSNGKIAREYGVKNGEFHGQLTEYQADGKLVYTCDFDYGAKNGKRKVYFTTGVLESETDYKNDEREGEEVTYWENGNKRLVLPYHLGSLHGVGLEYDENAKLIVEYTFYENQLIGEKKY